MQIGRDHALGSIVLLALAALTAACLRAGITPFGSPPTAIPHAACGPGTVAVEVAGDAGRNGVYFVPRGTSLQGLLDLAEIGRMGKKVSAGPHGPLKGAVTVVVLGEAPSIEVRPMAAAKRLALGIPIDINRSSREELILVPGIGEATAERILDQRRLAGMFRRLDDLLQVRGIKERRLERLKPYLCVGC
ncbi:MAG: hypothetical protein HPY67_01410 [Syntrophaceae bacterium]|nr:hypothetical protein [Syntrophaceae bacterium]